MNPKHFLVASISFVKKFLKEYFTLIYINQGFFYAFLLSIFIIFYKINNQFLNFLTPFIGIFALFKLLNSKRQVFFFTGFFVGIFWFYWISFSFIYYNLAYLIPIVMIFIGLVYGILFMLAGVFNNILIRALILILLSYIHPFGFNWFNLELILSNGIFIDNLRGILAVLAFIIYFSKTKNSFNKKRRIFLSILILSFGLDIRNYDPNRLNFKVKLISTNISQDQKWARKNELKFINDVLAKIDLATKEKYKFIVFPENALPLFLNTNDILLEILKNKSQNIDILVGALAISNNKIYNSSYLFKNGDFKRFDKAYLVPFGEYLPLPKMIKNFINDKIFKGDDFASSNQISKYKINNQTIVNAICYEATRPEIYKDNPKFVVAISNNGWFYPSSEPILQEILIRHFATLHNTTIYHSANRSKSKIITPRKPMLRDFF